MNDRSSLTPTAEMIAFATRMYDAARAGQLDIFQQALTAGLPVNMTNDKGDSLVRIPLSFFFFFFFSPFSSPFSSRPKF